MYLILKTTSAIIQQALGDLAAGQGQDQNHECHAPADSSVGLLLSPNWPRTHPQSTRDYLLTRTQSPKAATDSSTQGDPNIHQLSANSGLPPRTGLSMALRGERVQRVRLRALLSLLKGSVNSRESFNFTDSPLPYLKTRGNNLITSEKPCEDQVRAHT